MSVQNECKVRDLDIILSKISTYSMDRTSKSGSRESRETRESQLQAARRQTIAHRKNGTQDKREGLSVPKLQKRLNKTTNQLIAAINGRLPIV